jgi:phospho-N-acetylmuramoyl-pentapeptide-transferase
LLYTLLQNRNVLEALESVGLYPIIGLLNQLEFRAFAAVLLGFLIVLLLGRRTIRWLVKQKIGDAPEFHKAELNRLMASKASTPTMGGLLISGAILGSSLMLADLNERYVQLALVVLVWLAAVGGADDWLKLTIARRNPGNRQGLYAWEKLLFQLGVGAIVGVFVYRHVQDNDAAMTLVLPFQRTYVPGTFVLEDGLIQIGAAAFIIGTALLVAGTSNAVNLTDGMDGLAAGTTAVAAFAFMILCYIAGREQLAQTLMFPHIAGARELMVVTGAMAGACLGFLWFNCSPAHVFMGDTGSLSLGGLLAYTAIAIRQEVLLLIIGGVFFLEITSVILQVGYFKWTGGKRIFLCSPIRPPFHLKGWSEPQIVTRAWVLAVVLAMLAMISVKLR